MVGKNTCTRRSRRPGLLEAFITGRSGGPRWERANFKRVLAVDSFRCYAIDETNTIHALRLDYGVGAWKLETGGFDFFLGQDAHLGAAPEMWGRIYVASTNGVVQCIRPRR